MKVPEAYEDFIFSFHRRDTQRLWGAIQVHAEQISSSLARLSDREVSVSNFFQSL